MTKRVIAFIIAVMIPISLLGGCKGKQLTTQEYADEMYRCYRVFSQTILDLFMGNNGNKGLFSTFRVGNSDDIVRLKEVISRLEKAFDDIEKINPPDNYADIHKEIVKSLETERQRIEIWLKLEKAEDSANIEEIRKEADNLYDPNQPSYISLIVQLTTEFIEDPEITIDISGE